MGIVDRMRRMARRASSPPREGGVILVYHRVARLDSDPQLLAVGPENFGRQIEYLTREFDVLPLAELVGRASSGAKIAGSVSVTFDDGYLDNLVHAKPALEKYGAPATVFVVTGGVGGTREFWWDDLERIILGPRELPGEYRANISGVDHAWSLEGTHEVCPARRSAGRAGGRGWDVLSGQAPDPRQKMYIELCGLLRPLPAKARQDMLFSLAEWSGAGQTVRDTHRALSADEIVELARGGQVEVGAHTVSHPYLAALDREAQRAEITEGRDRLEEILGRRVSGFSYPFGNRGSYGPDTPGLVREAGFSYACSNFAGTVTGRTDIFQMPRFLVRDWDAGEFARNLRGWTDG